MKRIITYLFSLMLLVSASGLVIWTNSCDELEAPCDIVKTADGTFWISIPNLESWTKSGDYATLRFVFPDRTIFFVCTDRTIEYEATIEKRFDNIQFTVAPEGRLIWKYSAPPPSKAVLTGAGQFGLMFRLGFKYHKMINSRIEIAHAEGGLGGYFIPGFEVKIKSLGDRSSDYNFVYGNFRLYLDYKVTYRITY
jgi:hypothetical protein